MGKVFVISDTHFGHESILKFKRKDGSPLRPHKTLNEMHLDIIERWNNTVGPEDKVYHLGDVGFNKRDVENILPILNGKKRLILGNHDMWKYSFYGRFFQEIYGVRQINGVWLSHVPLLLTERVVLNIHGHTHANPAISASAEDSKRYLNASVEVNNYTPLDVTELLNVKRTAR